MPEGKRRWSVPPRRLGAAIVLSAFGVFFVCGGLGKGDLTVGALGLALIMVAAGIYVLSAIAGRDVPYVHGTAHVVSASAPPNADTFGRCTLQLLVTARNADRVPVKVRDPKVPLAKWPDAGTDLPVMVALGGSRKVRVLWNEVPMHGTAQAHGSGVRAGRPPSYPDGYEDAGARGTFGGGYGFANPGADGVDADTVVSEADDGIGDVMTSETDGAALDSTVLESSVLERVDYGPTDYGLTGIGSTVPGSVIDGWVVDGSVVDRPMVDSPPVDSPTVDSPTVSPVDDSPVDESPAGMAADGPDDGSEEVTVAPTIPAPRPGDAWPALSDVDPDGSDDEPLAALRVTETDGKLSIEFEVSGPTLIDSGAGPDDSATSTDAATGGTDDKPAALPRRRPSPRPRMGVNKPMSDAVRNEPTPPAPPAPPAPPTPPNPPASTASPESIPAVGTPPVTLPANPPPTEAATASVPALDDEAPFDPPSVDHLLNSGTADTPTITADVLLTSAALTDSMATVPIRFHQARVVSPGVSAAPDPDEFVFDQASDAGSVSDAYIAATPPPGAIGGGSRIRSVAATLFVTDLSRSIIFYRDVLGFTEADAGRGSAVLVSGDAKIVLRRVGMAPVDRRLVQLLLEVPDVNAAYEELRSRSIPFIHRPRNVGQYEQQTLWAAALRDPDGHGIAITQWRDLRD